MRSTIGQLEEFKKSVVWLDILEELEKWLEDVHTMLENQDVELAHPRLDRLGGNAEAIHHFRDILDTMIHSVEAEQKERELKREKENGRFTEE